MSTSYTRIGSVVKAHGIAGEVAIRAETGLEPVFKQQELFYVYDKKMDYYPARAESIRLVSKADQDLFFVKFDCIGSRNDAEALKGRNIYLPAHMVPDTEIRPDLTGYEVIDDGGKSYGKVVGLIDNPAHDLLQVSDGAGSFLIPVVDAYILQIDDENGRILARDIQSLSEI